MLRHLRRQYPTLWPVLYANVTAYAVYLAWVIAILWRR